MDTSTSRSRLLTALRDSYDQSLEQGAHALRSQPLLRAVDVAVDARQSGAWKRALVTRLVAFDLLASTIAALVVIVVQGGGNIPWLLTAAAVPAVWVLSCASARAYELRFLGTGSEEFRRVFDAGVRLLAIVALVALAARLPLLHPHVLFTLPLALALTLLTRCIARQQLYRQRAAGESQHRVLVVGRERSCAELVRQLRRESHGGFEVVGACIDRTAAERVEGVPVVGDSATIVEALQSTGADTVAVGAWSDLTQGDIRRLSWQLEGSGIALVVAPSLTDVAGPRIHIRQVSGVPLLHIEEPEFRGGRRIVKGAVDRLTALIALVVLLPVLVSLALAVRLTSSGPAIFRQERVGAAGETFTMYKFRTMHVGAEQGVPNLVALNEAGDGPLFKIRDDPRVTRVGRFLRRFSLDELPQLLNVVTGDMSLVGPRPPLPGEVQRYERDTRRRLLVRPGLTGLWQISGRSDLSWREAVHLDLFYVENWSLALDMVILSRTLSAVLARRGAY